MEVDFVEAQKVFSKFKTEQVFPSLNPRYIVADAKRSTDLVPRFFIFQEGENCYYHGFHFSKIDGTPFNDIQSPYGYGGPISTTEDQGFLDKAWFEYQNWCQKNSVLVEFMRFHPVLENGRYYKGECVADRETVKVDLTPSDLMEGYETRVRTAIRKAQKLGLTVEWLNKDSFLTVFKPIYEQAMKGIGASSFYFSKMNIITNFYHGKHAILGFVS